MATTTAAHISVEEYLKTAYHPDCDYVDGVLEERNLGEVDHGSVQARFAQFFLNLYKQTGLFAMTEVRMRLRERKYRIPDVMVTRGKPAERVVTTPPVLCIEILSSEDRIARLNTRIQDYLEFGVLVVWLVDPEERRLWVYRPGVRFVEATDSVTLDGTSIEVPFSEIFD
jgi:Uma2 family endonuclease